jgi:hypothetical protein
MGSLGERWDLMIEEDVFHGACTDMFRLMVLDQMFPVQERSDQFFFIFICSIRPPYLMGASLAM